MRCKKKIGKRRCLRESQTPYKYCWQHHNKTDKSRNQIGSGKEYLKDFWKKNTTTRFEGTSMIESFGMLYLLKKHQGECFYLSQSMIDENLSQTGNYHTDPLNEVAIRWQCFQDPDDNYIFKRKLTFPPGFWKNWDKCSMNPTKNFMIIPLILELWEMIDRDTGKEVIIDDCPNMDDINNKVQFGIAPHFNMLIINFKTKMMEHFEPNGSGDTQIFQGVYQVLHDLAIDPYYFGLNGYYPPSQVCPIGIIEKLNEDNTSTINPYKYQITQQASPDIVVGLQSFESIAEHKKGDPGGFCSAWSLFYADFRLTYPDLTQEQSTNILLKEFNRKGSTLENNLREFIRGYSEFIRVEGQKIYRNPNLFRKLIKEYVD